MEFNTFSYLLPGLIATNDTPGGPFQSDPNGITIIEEILTRLKKLEESGGSGGGGGGEASTKWGQITGTITEQKDLNSALSLKADKSTVTSELALKSDKTTVTNDLATKQDKLTAGANITIVDNVISSSGSGGETVPASFASLTGKPTDNNLLAEVLETKADKTTLETSLTLKADKSTVTSELALKSDKTTVTNDLATKQDKLTAGDNITIVGNVISSSGSGGSGTSGTAWGQITGDITKQEDLNTRLNNMTAYTDGQIKTVNDRHPTTDDVNNQLALKTDLTTFNSYKTTTDSHLTTVDSHLTTIDNHLTMIDNEIKTDVDQLSSRIDTTNEQMGFVTKDIANKQDKLTAGTGIVIVDNVISATSTSSAGSPITLTSTLANPLDLNAMTWPEGSGIESTITNGAGVQVKTVTYAAYISTPYINNVPPQALNYIWGLFYHVERFTGDSTTPQVTQYYMDGTGQYYRTTPATFEGVEWGLVPSASASTSEYYTEITLEDGAASYQVDSYIYKNTKNYTNVELTCNIYTSSENIKMEEAHNIVTEGSDLDFINDITSVTYSTIIDVNTGKSYGIAVLSAGVLSFLYNENVPSGTHLYFKIEGRK